MPIGNSAVHSAACAFLLLLSGTGVSGWAQEPAANQTQVVIVTDVGNIVQSLVKRTEEFKDEFDKAIEHSLMDGSKLEDRAKHRADDLHDDCKRLREIYNEKREKDAPRVREQVDKTLAAASDLNRIMAEHRFTEPVQQSWTLLCADFNTLAAFYRLSPI